MTKENPTETKAPANGVRKRSARTFTSINSDIIEVIVGSGKHKYCVHKDILCASSPFFRNACNGKWKEARERRVELPEDDPRSFGIYVHWLYFNELFEEEGDDGCRKIPWGDFLGVYLLADKLLDQRLKDACFDIVYTMYETRKGSIALNQASTLYEKLPASDPYRRLYVEIWANWKRSHRFHPEPGRDTSEAPMEFFRDVACALNRLKGHVPDFRNNTDVRLKRSDFYKEPEDTTVREEAA